MIWSINRYISLLSSIILSWVLFTSYTFAYINLTVTKTWQREYVAQWDERVRYTIDITNLWVSTATGIRLTDFMMPGLSYQSSTAIYTSQGMTLWVPGSQSSTSIGTTGTRDIPAIAPNQTGRLTYTARIVTPEVSSGLILFLDTQNIVSGLDGANNILTRFDRSPLSNHMYGTAPNYPIYSITRPRSTFLRPTIISSNAQNLSKAGWLNGGGNLNGISIISVIKPQSSPAWAITDIISHLSPTVHNGLYLQLSGGRDLSLEFWAGLSGGRLVGTSMMSMNTPYLIDAHATIHPTAGLGTMSLSVNGALIANKTTSVTSPVSLTTSDIYLIDHLSNVGSIEMPIMMVYNRTLSPIELQLVRNYLSRKIGLNTARQSAIGYYSPSGVSISGQIFTPPVTPWQSYIDLSIVSHTSVVTGTVSGSQISFVLQYANYNAYGQTATGVFLDYTMGAWFTYQTWSRIPTSPFPTNPSLLRFALPDMAPNTTGNLIITGLVTGLSGTIAGVNNAMILRLNNNAYIPDVVNTNDTRSAGGILILSTGTLITGTNLSGVSPLIVLRELMTKYTAIITKANPPLIMSDVANSPYLSHIATMVNNGLMIWYNKNWLNRFWPNNHLTRAEFAIILWRIASLQSSNSIQFVFTNSRTRFVDVSTGSSYERFVAQIDALWWIDAMGVGVWTTNLLYFNPNQKVTQSQMRSVLSKVLTMRGYDPVILDRFPGGSGPVTRWETAYLLAELIWNDPNIVLGNNHRLLNVIVRRLEAMTGNIAGQRLIAQRILDNVGRTDTQLLQSVWLIGKGVQRDLTDALSGSIRPKSNQSLPSVYNPPVWWGSDPFEALLLEWSK